MRDDSKLWKFQNCQNWLFFTWNFSFTSILESCVLLKERWSIHKTPICSKCESSECEPDLSFGPLCQLGAQSSEEQANCRLHKDKRCPYCSSKATCEDLNWLCLLVNLLEKRNKLTCSSDHLLLYWTAGVVKNVSKGANESFSLLILSSVDIRFKKNCCPDDARKKWLTNSPSTWPSALLDRIPDIDGQIARF